MLKLETIHDGLANTTQRLEAQLSTRRIGVFPDFLPDVIDLLETAAKEALIFCPFPAYGELSNPDEYSRYADVIRRKGGLVPELSRAVRAAGWPRGVARVGPRGDRRGRFEQISCWTPSRRWRGALEARRTVVISHQGTSGVPVIPLSRRANGRHS
jgi:hypothetical protein